MKLPILTVLALITAGAAQACSGTISVTDCTLLRDPTLLRDCIDRFEGHPPAPGTILSGTPPVDVDATGSIAPPAPFPLTPSELKAAAGSGRAEPRSKGSKVWVKQISPRFQPRSAW
jgi:hypothetical protein